MPDRSAPCRILIVDDNPAIHEDFRHALCPAEAWAAADALAQLEHTLFGETQFAPQPASPAYELEFAEHGEEALDRLRAARDAGRPFAMAFMDIRMPPGWDGVETIQQLWKIDPELQIGICSAYSDYTQEQMAAAFRGHEAVAVIRKPFDREEVQGVALRLTERWKAQHTVRPRSSRAA